MPATLPILTAQRFHERFLNYWPNDHDAVATVYGMLRLGIVYSWGFEWEFSSTFSDICFWLASQTTNIMCD